MLVRALTAALAVLSVALPICAGEAQPVEADLLEFLGEIEISAEDWAALADAEPAPRPVDAPPAPRTKEDDDGKQ